MLLVYIYVALASYNTGNLTLPLSSIETIIDDAANVATIDRGKKRKERTIQDWREIWDMGTDACLDVPLGGVCEILYGELREGED